MRQLVAKCQEVTIVMNESVRRCSRNWDHLPTESVAWLLQVQVQVQVGMYVPVAATAAAGPVAYVNRRGE